MSTVEEAMAEAYASNPADDPVLDTLEFHHPAFVDDFGVRTAIRIVQANQAYHFRLEDNALLNPGEMVEFLPLPFDLTVPGFAKGQVPTMRLSISNINRLITKYLEMAIDQTDAIQVFYRPYLLSNPDEPTINPVIEMGLVAAKSGVFDVSGTATLSDVHNWPFPLKKYVIQRFPGLLR